ncbi:MAG: alanine dehydrogenase, partial [Bdellovibrionales bacterium]|nr:alanine dehydrogenase [Bdellovibrionales bacterium]
MDEFIKFKSIALAKECISPENPGGLEKRVALVPADVKRLVEHGLQLFFEEGCGQGIGYQDQEYLDAGGIQQSADQIYCNSDLIIKFKGPSLESIPQMKPGTTLFCMAHFHSFPQRAALLKAARINVIAMEAILESPKIISDQIILSKRFVEEVIHMQQVPYRELHLGFLGYHDNMVGGIRRAGNRRPNTLTIYQSDIDFEELRHLGPDNLYLYDSREFNNQQLLEQLSSHKCQLHDLAKFVDQRGKQVVEEYRNGHPPFHFGGRRIQCLHETGMAGARYGFKLFNENSKPGQARASVLGYGNVGMGAIHECYRQGVRATHVLGASNTTPERISEFISRSDVIINGAEQPTQLRGVNYLIKREYIGSTIKPGSVVIDLIGGSSSNRSPVEDVIECTYLTDPHFERNGVTFSSLWGWPLMGMMEESAVKYSDQIVDVLLKKER